MGAPSRSHASTTLSPAERKRLFLFDRTLLLAMAVFTLLPTALSFDRLWNAPPDDQTGWGFTFAFFHVVALVLFPIIAWKRWWSLGAACVAVAGGAAVSGVHYTLAWEAGAGSLAVFLGYLLVFGLFVGRVGVESRLEIEPPGLVTLEPRSTQDLSQATGRIADGALAMFGIVGSLLSTLFGFGMALYPSGPPRILIPMLALGVVGLAGITWSVLRRWLHAGLAMMATPVIWLLIIEDLLEFTLLYPLFGVVLIAYYATSPHRA